MSFKDDFLEAWRSVKRDFFRDSNYSATTQNNIEETPSPDRTAAPPPPAGEPIIYDNQPSQPVVEPPIFDLPPQVPTFSEDESVFDNFMKASAPPPGNESDILDEDSNVFEEDNRIYNEGPVKFRHYDAEFQTSADQRKILDHFEGDGGVYSDDKTIISRNTIIRGALQTEDSVRLLGQVLGDIDCKSNIVVAGKVRGNTSAANAYIFDAQVDGDVRCDDVINVSNDAWVLGNIRAQQAEIDGKIKGNIEIRHVVSIGATSSVLGDISADELEIKRGAFINGQIMMYSPSRDVLDKFDQFGEK